MLHICRNLGYCIKQISCLLRDGCEFKACLESSIRKVQGRQCDRCWTDTIHWHDHELCDSNPNGSISICVRRYEAQARLKRSPNGPLRQDLPRNEPPLPVQPNPQLCKS